MEKPSRIDLLSDMLAKEPNDVFLNYAMAMEHLAITDFKKAELQLQKTLAINSEYLPCYYQLGQVHEKLGNIIYAIDYYKKGIALAKIQNNTKALGELNEALWMLEE